jgi:hypothetical protein
LGWLIEKCEPEVIVLDQRGGSSSAGSDMEVEGVVILSRRNVWGFGGRETCLH